MVEDLTLQRALQSALQQALWKAHAHALHADATH